MARADLAHALQVAVGRDEDAVGARHGFEDERGDRRRPLEPDGFLQLLQRGAGGLGAPLDTVVGVEHVDDAAGMLVRPAAGVARSHHGVAGRTVVRAIVGQDLGAPGDRAGDLDRVLVGVGAAQGEENLVDVAWQQLGQLLAEPRARLGRHEGDDESELLGLLLDRIDDPVVPVAGVDAHQLAVEVDEAAAVHGGEVHAIGAGDRHRLKA